MLKSRQYLPPSGWIYYQPETNWELPPNLGFNEAVAAIIQHRQANPRFNLATDVESVNHELDVYTETRLRQTYGAQADQWLAGPPAPPPQSFNWPRLRSRAAGASVAEGAKQVKAGIGLIRDFLGPTLKAVPHALAEKRSAVCVTCPANQKGGMVAHLGGEALKLMLQARSDLKLETSYDDRLFDCAICNCNLHVKPHVELAYILENTPPEVMAAFPAHCWILKRDQ